MRSQVPVIGSFSEPNESIPHPHTLFFKLREKVKVKVTGHHAIKAYWGVEVYVHAFFGLGNRWR
jgi:hypothetical protein